MEKLEQFTQRVTKSGRHPAKCFYFQMVLFLFSLASQFVRRLSSPENSGVWRKSRGGPAVCIRDTEEPLWPDLGLREGSGTPLCYLPPESKAHAVQTPLLLPFQRGFGRTTWWRGMSWRGVGEVLRQEPSTSKSPNMLQIRVFLPSQSSGLLSTTHAFRFS